MMAAASTAVAMGRLSASPPSLTGLSRKSPKVAPNGRVSMKAAQNRTTREIRVRKYSAAINARAAPKTSAPPRYPSPVSSAIQSPRAVPSVCENVIVAQ